MNGNDDMDHAIYVRNEWQTVSLQVTEAQEHVSITNDDCRGRQTNDVVMFLGSFELNVGESGVPDDYKNVKIDFGVPPALEKVRFATIMTHTPIGLVGDPPTFSNAVVEFSETFMVITAFPFTPNRCYAINVQFFYRVI
jgi:hypothetical protein